MSLMKKLAMGTATAALLAAAPAAVYAQETTSDVRGVVTSGGTPVSGATITIIHTPSGSTSVSTSGANGSFNGRGLRVGGPYTIVVSAAGYTAQQIEGIQLSLGAPLNLPVSLERGSVDQIVVTASAMSFGDLSTGPAARFTSDDINGLPSISRDPRDIARLSPFANVDSENSGAISLAGANNRFNSFTVDGVAQNDMFGLNASGFPSENRGPVSIDSLAAISVEVAPFDVQYNGFGGGTINAVTRSGDNDFHGSAYFFTTDESMVGDTTEDVSLSTSDFSEETRGLWLSGPIIEDKLFFFASYEDFTRVNPLNLAPSGGPAALNTVNDVTQAEVDQILSIMQSVYGLNLTNFDEVDLTSTDEKILVSVDWNINNDHRAKLTYNTSVGGSVQERSDRADIGTPSTWYNRAEDVENLSLQVFSDWSDNFSTELKITQSTQETTQASVDGSDFAQFDIDTPSGGTVSVGPDYFRHANALSNELFQIKLRGEYISGNHIFSFGFEHQSQDVFNLFVPGSEGSYDFDSITDLQNQVANSLFYNNAVTNDANDAAAEFGYSVNSFYAQDELLLSDQLTMIFGLRYDTYSTDDAPTANPNFMARYGYTNNTNIDGLDILMPRIAFNYDLGTSFDMPFADIAVNDVTFRGGFGRFSGGNPVVWISNSFSNDGVNTDSIFIGGPLAGVSAVNLPAAATSGLIAGDGSVAALAPDFEVPSVWRASFGADVQFDIMNSEDWLFTFDVLYDTQDAATFFSDANCPLVGASNVDGRPMYNCSTARQDIVMSNVDEGNALITTFQLAKDWDSGFSLWVSYANQDVTDAHSGTSSTQTSNYSDYATFDRQNPHNAISNYEIEHDWKLRASWRHAFFEDYETRIELFMNSHSGRHFSYTYDYSNGNANQYRNQSPFGIHESAADDEGTLFYVPTADASGNVTLTSDPLINYTAGFDITGFNAYLHSTGLIGHSGEIAPRNEFTSEWSTIFDLRFQQEFPAFFPNGARGIFYMDIENLGNLLNSDWGRSEGVRYEYFQPVVEIDDIDAVTGAYLYDDFRGDSASENRIHRSSLWQIQFGVRYQF